MLVPVAVSSIKTSQHREISRLGAAQNAVHIGRRWLL
jgi:hypothetical protein